MMLFRPLLLVAVLIATIPAPALAGPDDLPDWKSDAATIALPPRNTTLPSRSSTTTAAPKKA